MWTSKKQPCIALSAFEAEIVAMTVGVQDSLWLREALSEILPSVAPVSVELCRDNQAATEYALGISNHPVARHIAVKFLFIRRLFDQVRTTLNWIVGTKNPADSFTKRLSRALRNAKRHCLGLKTPGSVSL